MLFAWLQQELSDGTCRSIGIDISSAPKCDRLMTDGFRHACCDRLVGKSRLSTDALLTMSEELGRSLWSS